MSEEKKIAVQSPISIERVAFGVRFQPRYELLDHLGGVIDRILRLEGSPFNPNFFPLSTREPGQHILFNPETRNELRISNSDVILDINVGDQITSTIDILAENYATFVLDSLREVGRLKDIVRYGVLFRLEECHAALSITPLEHFIQQDFRDARSLSLRFTKRLPKLEAFAKKHVDDFGNVIYTVKQTEEGEVRISVDYQEYFMPELNAKEFSQKPFKQFIGRGISYFLGDFQNWLRKIIKKEEAA